MHDVFHAVGWIIVVIHTIGAFSALVGYDPNSRSRIDSLKRTISILTSIAVVWWVVSALMVL